MVAVRRQLWIGFIEIRKNAAVVRALAVAGLCTVMLDCGGGQMSWSAESRSPDGRMIARARTIQPSGIGTGVIGTSVDLNWTTGSQQPVLILAFADGNDQPDGDKTVGLIWMTPNHLELTYKGLRTIDFQAIKCHGVEITVRDTSILAPSILAPR